MSDTSDVRYAIGQSPVTAAIAGRQGPARKVLFDAKRQQRDKKLRQLIERCQHAGIKTVAEPTQTLDRIAKGGPHQGIVAVLPPFSYADEETLLEALEGCTQPLLVACDEIHDPQNFGSICRSALAFGADFVIVPERRSCPITPVVSRASAGAIESVRIAQVRNLADTLTRLREVDVWSVGLAMDGSQPLATIDFSGGHCLVVGNEGAGLRKRVASCCDMLARIDMPGPMESLNAAVATAIALYAATR